jgi:CRP-like cAMP-binding protein
VPKGIVRASLRDDPEFSEAWMAHLARELQSARFRGEMLSLPTVAGRLDAWIAWHDGRLPDRGRWRLLAAEIGVSPEALYRELAKRRR